MEKEKQAPQEEEIDETQSDLPVGEDDGEGEEAANVTPQEQALYDFVMVQAHENLYSEQGVKSLMEKFSSMKDRIPFAVGHTAAMLMRSVGGGLEQNGIPVDQNVLFHAGTELVADIVEIAVAAKIIPEEQAAEVGQQAIFEGLKAYGEQEMRSGKLTPEKQQAARADLDGAKEFAHVAKAMKTGMPQQQPQQPGLVESKGV